MSLDEEFSNNDKNDLESSLLQQFSCMSTSNKDDLIQQFQHFIAPNQLNAEGCTFFLELANWNLQQAICSYFDYDAHKLLQQPLPTVSFIADVTIGEGEEILPNTRFVKTWKIANTGPSQWPQGCFLTFLSGSRMGPLERILVEALKPGDVTDISISMISPPEPGTYQGQWRMCTNTGQYFGDIIWCIITVSEHGLLSITQQMNSINVLGQSNTDKPKNESNNLHNEHSNNHQNPFEQTERRIPQINLMDSEMQIDEDNKN